MMCYLNLYFAAPDSRCQQASSWLSLCTFWPQAILIIHWLSTLGCLIILSRFLFHKYAKQLLMSTVKKYSTHHLIQTSGDKWPKRLMRDGIYHNAAGRWTASILLSNNARIVELCT